MSDEYSTLYLIVTDYLPELIVAFLLVFSLVGISIRFFKDPR